MVWVIKSGVHNKDEFALVNPEETRVIENFKILDITENGDLFIADSGGRKFHLARPNKEIWIHQRMLLRFPEYACFEAGKHEYRRVIEFHVNDGYKLHFKRHLQRNYPELYNQLQKVHYDFLLPNYR